MTRINPYLHFDGNCKQAFDFYKSVFGGDYSYIGRFRDMPDNLKSKVTAKELDRIMHVSLPIGNGSFLMGSDVTENFGERIDHGNNFAVSISVKSREEADRVFHALSDSGTILSNLQDTFWGSYYGMFRDKFGVYWMVSYDAGQ